VLIFVVGEKILQINYSEIESKSIFGVPHLKHNLNSAVQ